MANLTKLTCKDNVVVNNDSIRLSGSLILSFESELKFSSSNPITVKQIPENSCDDYLHYEALNNGITGQVLFKFKKQVDSNKTYFRFQIGQTSPTTEQFFINIQPWDEWFDGNEHLTIGGDNKTNIGNNISGNYLSILSSNGTVSQIEELSKSIANGPQTSIIISSPKNEENTDCGYFSIFVSDEYGYTSNITPFNNIEELSPIYLYRDSQRGNVLDIENATEHNRGVVRPDGSLLKMTNDNRAIMYLDENNLRYADSNTSGVVKINSEYFELNSENQLSIKKSIFATQTDINEINGEIKRIKAQYVTTSYLSEVCNNFKEQIDILHDMVASVTTYMVESDVYYTFNTNDVSKRQSNVVTLLGIDLYGKTEEGEIGDRTSIEFGRDLTKTTNDDVQVLTQIYTSLDNLTIGFPGHDYIRYRLSNTINFKDITNAKIGDENVNLTYDANNNCFVTSIVKVDDTLYPILNRIYKTPNLTLFQQYQVTKKYPTCSINMMSPIYHYNTQPDSKDPFVNSNGWSKISYNFGTDTQGVNKLLYAGDGSGNATSFGSVGANIYVAEKNDEGKLISYNLNGLNCATNEGILYCYATSNMYAKNIGLYFSTIHTSSGDYDDAKNTFINKISVNEFNTTPSITTTKPSITTTPETTPIPTPKDYKLEVSNVPTDGILYVGETAQIKLYCSSTYSLHWDVDGAVNMKTQFEKDNNLGVQNYMKITITGLSVGTATIKLWSVADSTYKSASKNIVINIQNRPTTTVPITTTIPPTPTYIPTPETTPLDEYYYYEINGITKKFDTISNAQTDAQKDANSYNKTIMILWTSESEWYKNIKPVEQVTTSSLPTIPPVQPSQILKTGSGTVSISNWTEGSTASIPKVYSTTNGTANVTYTYYNSNKTKLVSKPTKAGTYYIKATFAANSTYDTFTTGYVQFVINPADDKPFTFSITGGLTDGNSYKTAQEALVAAYTYMDHNPYPYPGQIDILKNGILINVQKY